MELGIAGRSALVCASSTGLGLACASALADAGADVILNGRSEEKLRQAAATIRRRGGTVRYLAADLAAPNGRAALVAAQHPVDILITNNGGPAARPTTEVGIEDLACAVEMNMMAAIELMQAVAPGMAERGFGRIVHITSAAVEMPLEGLAASTAARAGLTAFSAALARRYASANVAINCLEPGFFLTDRTHQLAGEQLDSMEVLERRFDVTVPAARLGRPEEFGRICAFFCSEHIAYVTGQRLLIDGGLVRRT